MNVPKVYFNNHTAKWNYERQNNDDTEYIRTDLAELTWEDIRVICDCFMDVGLHSELPARSKGFYKEVLRRFLESKKEVEL